MDSTKVKQEEFYKDAYSGLRLVERRLLDLLDLYKVQSEENSDLQPIIYTCSRIKKPDRMLKKLEKRGLEQTLHAALNDVYDAVGVRAVCAFADDVYRLVHWLKSRSGIEILQEKDYYANPKPNGYRSYHVIVRIQITPNESYYAELQIRTIASDFWATLEHRLKYKKDIPHEKIIRDELERCAVEIVSVDASMQAIRDLLRGEQ